MPPATDCSELGQLGIKSDGVFYIDPSGQRKTERGIRVYCENGWTYILKRGQYKNGKVSDML